MRESVAVIIFSIITLGIYFLVWTYKVFKENKDFSGEGVGGVIGLVIGDRHRHRELVPAARPRSATSTPSRVARSRSPVSPGFWNLIPLIGFIIWVVKVQGAMNRVYE